MAGWKTIVFNLVAVIVAIAGLFGYREFTPDPAVQQIIAALPAVLAIIVPLVNLILRQFTRSESGLVKALKTK